MVSLVDYLIGTLGHYPVFALTGAFAVWVIWLVWPKAGDAVEKIGMDEYQRLAEKPHILIDVRTPEEFAQGHAPQAVSIPLDQLLAADRDALNATIGDKAVVCICATGRRSAMAARRLAKLGYNDVHNLKGGMHAWSAARLSVRTET